MIHDEGTEPTSYMTNWKMHENQCTHCNLPHLLEQRPGLINIVCSFKDGDDVTEIQKLQLSN